MESHLSHQAQRQDSVTLESKKFTQRVELSEKFQGLLKFALKYYPTLKEAGESDDAQESFTSAGVNFRKGVESTTLAALRAANEQSILKNA
jgi:hypothetical protein